MKRRILFILHLPPPVHGAAMVGKYIQDSKIINNTFDCRYVNLSIAASLEDIEQVGIKKLFNFIKLLWTIRKEVKAFRPDLVYVTPNTKDAPFYKDCTVVEWLKLLGCHVVAHFHNKGVSLRQHRWLDDKLYTLFFKNMKVILLAEALYADMAKYVDRKDVFICPNGIPDIFGQTAIKKQKKDTAHILFLSNLIESKGVLVLLEALQILKIRGLSFICDVVGGETAEIDAKRFVAEVSRRDLTDLVIYHGSKYGEEKNVFFQIADVFAFPTFYDKECFPLVLLEAMQQGVPCISTNEGGISAIIEDGVTGFIIPKHQASPLTDSFERLIADEMLRKKMGAAGRMRFEREFTLATFEKRLIDIFQKIV